MTQEDLKIITETLQELLRRLCVEAEIETRFLEDVTVFNVRSADSALLIGTHGASLGSLQHLLRVLVSRKISEPAHIVLDVEDYKKSREDFLRELAKQAAERVIDTKQTLLLKPMMPYERRVVHSEIAHFPEVVSESQGEDPERRVLIKPRSNL